MDSQMIHLEECQKIKIQLLSSFEMKMKEILFNEVRDN